MPGRRDAGSVRFIADSISHDVSGDHDSHETRLARGSLIDGAGAVWVAR